MENRSFSFIKMIFHSHFIIKVEIFPYYSEY